MARKFLLWIFAGSMIFVTLDCWGAEPVKLEHSRAELEDKWRMRIQSFLDKGVIPIIDLESGINKKDMEIVFPDGLKVLDALGIALIAFDGHQRPRDGSQGYRWSFYILDLVNRHPEYFIPTANAGTNPNWIGQKGGAPWHYIDQMEKYIRAGVYAHMGEFEVRHYYSNGDCKRGQGRDVDIPLDGTNGHRLFRLSAETGVPFVLHLEPEDRPLEALESMLRAYPKAKVIVAHFGQIRYPEKETRFGPDLVRRLLSTYPNLYYDISTGGPNRAYVCNPGLRSDVVLWKEGLFGQTDELSPAYKAVLNKFSSRFVTGLDHGGGRGDFERFMTRRVETVRLIVRDLTDEAKHAIGYRNAWKLITGREWSK